MLDINPEGLSDDQLLHFRNAWPNIGSALEDRVRRSPMKIAYSYPDSNDVWQDISWASYQDWVHQYAAGLADLGVRAGDRVAVIAGTSIQWLVADLARSCLGAVTTTIYPNAPVNDFQHILHDSGVTYAIVQNQKIISKLQACDTEQLQAVIAIDDRGLEAADKVMRWADIEDRGRSFAQQHPDYVGAQIDKTNHESIATIMYTSGTTGLPKGVVSTHGAWIYLAHALGLWPIIGEDDVHLLWLPMSHAFGKALVLVGTLTSTKFAVDGRPDKIFDNLKTVRPTMMCGVPRVFEKVRAAAITGSRQGSLKSRAAQWAFHVGREAYPYRSAGKTMPPALAARYQLADKLVFNKLRALFGGRLRFCISGSAKLSPQVQQWFYNAGVPIYEGYGATEACAVDFFNHPPTPYFGTVGPQIPGSWVRIDDDGEILFKAPCVMQGYLNNPEKTAETITSDGYLRTGDIGHWDEHRNLIITDRKKDLIKTSGGKYIAPSDVEAAITANCPYVAHAVVAGEGKKYAVALLTLDEPALMTWASKRKITKSYAELTQLPEIHASISRYMEKANSKLGSWETVKQFAILDHDLTIEDGSITPNMKIRRAKVIAEHADIIAGLYDEDDVLD
ncbi:MAG: AMP-dependent synthetase/ligase [Propionibacteriaceae bacterium]